MNHDYCHCLDYTKDCPRECFRAQLEEDVKKNPLMIGVPLTYSHLGGTDECKLAKRREEGTRTMKWMPVSERLPKNDEWL